MRTVQRAAVTAVLYLLAARFAMALHDFDGLGAVFWPGAGVTVTALLVSPRRSWPAILFAIGAAEFVNDLVLGFGVLPSATWAVANMTEPLATAWLLRAWNADGFADVRATTGFVVAAFAGPALGALIGAVGTAADATPLPYAVTAMQWMIGDGLGILTIVPFGLVVLRRLPGPGLRQAEATLAWVAVAVTVIGVFGARDGGIAVASDYLVLIPMVWAAVRLRVVGAAVSVFVAAQIGNLFHALGRGPFSGDAFSVVEGSVHLQVFLGTVSATMLLLASRTVESESFHDLAQARQHLIAAVSHELRTPLTPIVGFSELLLRRSRDTDGFDEEARQALEAIQRNGRHLTALVEDLLQASRASRGALPTHPTVIDVERLLAGLLMDRATEAVETRIRDPGVRLWADRTHVVQILTNLLDNAHRHGRPPVRLEALADGDTTVLSVSDHGAGVPDWFVPHLFDAFAQASGGDQRSSVGLGLGLPIARDLARANGGDLVYDPDPHAGRFLLRLPAERGAPVPTPPASAGAVTGPRAR